MNNDNFFTYRLVTPTDLKPGVHFVLVGKTYLPVEQIEPGDALTVHLPPVDGGCCGWRVDARRFLKCGCEVYERVPKYPQIEWYLSGLEINGSRRLYLDDVLEQNIPYSLIPTADLQKLIEEKEKTL